MNYKKLWTKHQLRHFSYVWIEIINALQKLGLIKDSMILNVGCNEGTLDGHLYKLGFRNIYAFDISTKAIEIARTNFPEMKDRFFVHDAYKSELPLPQKPDLIISSEVIEHLLFPKTYVENMNNWLKRGGYLILTNPLSWLSKKLGNRLTK